MKKFALYFLLIISYFGFNNIVADGIRLYQENDRACLNAMLAGNKELLLPGDNLEEQVAKTTKFFGSKNYTTKVFVKDDIPVGFITYQKKVQGNWLIRWITGSLGVIQLFNVHEEHRRNGIGTALFNAALADMEKNDFKAVMLQTKVTNTTARSFYEKKGFTLLVSSFSDCFYKRKLLN